MRITLGITLGRVIRRDHLRSVADPSFLLKEDGGFILKEDGGRIRLT